MHKDLNNSICRKLENEVKKLSDIFDITVTIEIVFSKEDTTKGGATIPSDFIYSYEYIDFTKTEMEEEIVDTVYFYDVEYGYDMKSGVSSAKLFISDSTNVTYTKNLKFKPKKITRKYIITNTKPTRKKISDYEIII